MIIQKYKDTMMERYKKERWKYARMQCLHCKLSLCRQFADSIACQLPVNRAITYLTLQSKTTKIQKIKHMYYSATIFTPHKDGTTQKPTQRNPSHFPLLRSSQAIVTSQVPRPTDSSKWVGVPN